MGLKRKNRRKRPIGTLIILASSIIMVNLLGVSYAYWNDNINITASISTGYIQPRFIGDEYNMVGNSKASRSREEVEDESIGEITARFINDNTLEISGWCYPNYNENISVRVGNDGTIPITYKGMEADDEDGIVKKIQYKGSNIKEYSRELVYGNQDMIETKDEEDIKIHIQTENEGKIKYGNRSFTYQLQFEQGLR